MHGTTITGPSNYRDASSVTPWKEKPTPIQVPGYRPARDTSATNKNPYKFTNNLDKPRGNPVRSQTLLATARNPSPTDLRPSKRPKLEAGRVPPTTSPYFGGITTNGQGPSSARASSHAHDSEPEIQEVGNPLALRGRHTRTDDGEIIVLDDHPDDMGCRVAHAGAATTNDRSSPDPILMTPASKLRKHAFETHPGQLSAVSRDKGKRRETDFRKPVSASEESEDGIESWNSDQPRTSFMRTPAIPNGIVQHRLRTFEKSAASKSARPHGDVPALDLLILSNGYPKIAQQMRRKDEVVDRVGTSSSGLIDSRKKRDSKIYLPLEVWYLGHREFRREGDVPDQLTYNDGDKTLVLAFGRPVRKLKIKLDRQVSEAKVTNDNESPLEGNPVIEFTTIEGDLWKRWEEEFRDQFQAGEQRRLGALTLVFSTDLTGWSLTMYQRFVGYLKSVVLRCHVIRPSGALSLWNQAQVFADMEVQIKKRRRHETTRVSSLAGRSSTPSSSSAKTRISARSLKPPESKSSDRELRRSARQSAAQSTKSTPTPVPPQFTAEQDELILMYPSGGPGALNIMRSDMKRLEPEEYLNDTLIEFGLKLWLNELREKDPLLADQIHVFSSFFYKKLNTKNSEEGYQSVRKWTSKVDLFSKKYVIVPINENLHWYLAIIYEPGHVLEPPMEAPPSTQARLTRNRKKGRTKADAKTGHPESRSEAQGSSTSSMQEDEGGLLSKAATRPTTPSVTQDVDMEVIDGAHPNGAESDSKLGKPPSGFNGRAPSELVYPSSPLREVAMDVDVVESSVGRPALPSPSLSDRLLQPQSGIPASSFYGPLVSKKRVKKPVAADDSVVIVDSEDESDKRQEAEVDNMLREVPPDSPQRPSQTYILTLDSLGARHTQVVKVLKTYLSKEAKDKRGFDEVREAVGKQVQVPVQPNTWDCGVYLLHLTKVFMNKPEHYFRMITTTKGTIPSSDRRNIWQDQEVPRFRDYLFARITQLSEAWKAEKAVKEEEARKRKSEELEAEVLSSEGEVDIVDVSGEVKVSPRRRRVNRLRG
ncbi:hypothetical protein EDC04DRAFT_2658082 [Pisolithus marmoratus]|nr:hypothetical protein EDC04DRAFT_2658082 [Pisolithus marmoratus]